jgi:hypothetical protein
MASSRAPLALTALAGVTLSLPGHAQITSSFNAGQNSGNNGFTTIGTPNFSQNKRISLVPGVTVAPNGDLEASPQTLDAVRQSLASTLPASLVPTALAIPSEPPAPVSRIASGMALLAGSDPVALKGSVPSPGVQLRPDGLHVNLDSELVVLPVTPSTQPALLAYSRQAVQLGISPASFLMGAEWVKLGTPVESTAQLVASFQGLAKEPNLNRLDDAITAYNAILKSASPELRGRLSDSQTFLALSRSLRNARAVVSSKP